MNREKAGVIRLIRRGNWCQRQELNLRPKAYESSALPLSYSGKPGEDNFPTIVACQIE